MDRNFLTKKHLQRSDIFQQVFLQGNPVKLKTRFFEAGRIVRTIHQQALWPALYPEETKHGGRSTDFASSSNGTFPDHRSSGTRRFCQLHGCWDSAGFSPASLMRKSAGIFHAPPCTI
jgi:hypothetical protein